MPKVKNILISYCGIVCEYCKAYTRKLCGGCDTHINECVYAKCASKKGIRVCLECEDFPCKMHREGFKWKTKEFGTLYWKIYSDIFLKLFAGELYKLE